MPSETESPDEPGMLSQGSFSGSEQPDRSGPGLQYQSFEMSQQQIGVNGRGRRVAPSPEAQFSNPPMSRAQFGGGGGARDTIGGDEEL
jgi:hypothetical protein